MQLILPQQCRYYMHGLAVDMRKGFDSLSGVVQRDFKESPLSGDVFIFINHQRNRIKLLHWQGDGFAIFYKRLEQGTYEIPDTYEQQNSIVLTSHQLQFILDGIVLSSIRKRARFHREIVNKV